MTFHYSRKRLIDRFILRVLPTFIFLYFALLFGKELWWVFGFLWAEMLIELFIMKKIGYVKIDNEKIRSLNPLNPATIPFYDIKSVYDYNGELTFRGKGREIRMNRKYISKTQLEEFEKRVSEIRARIDHLE